MKNGRPENHPLANRSHLVLQRWRKYGDGWVWKVSTCCNCQGLFEEPINPAMYPHTAETKKLINTT